MPAPKQFRVKAAAVVIYVGTAAERYLYAGALLPESVTEDERKRLVELGLVEAVAAPAAKPAGKPAAKAAGEPAGEVLYDKA